MPALHSIIYLNATPPVNGQQNLLPTNLTKNHRKTLSTRFLGCKNFI